MPVRIGAPSDIAGLTQNAPDPGLALSIGLVQLALNEEMEHRGPKSTKSFALIGNLKEWLEDIF